MKKQPPELPDAANLHASAGAMHSADQYCKDTTAGKQRYPHDLITSVTERQQRWFAEYGWRAA